MIKVLLDYIKVKTFTAPFVDDVSLVEYGFRKYNLGLTCCVWFKGNYVFDIGVDGVEWVPSLSIEDKSHITDMYMAAHCMYRLSEADKQIKDLST